ncbi:hypothetical protein QBC38DRAFT_530547 [Podospora fimiseda]|uniref:Pinin/SDK/MemA protein domain-containing protein n=1 Tax=Podospora fimiseda TaxID=252190 RepID=A0AAN7BLM7_9PEZI|nr:hypothetical protein QBC38DRAFT_530547 [Podospora fimiseda]
MDRNKKRRYSSSSTSPTTRPTKRVQLDYDIDDYDKKKKKPVITQEDKKRGKRLFGGVLSTLSQPTTTSLHQKRKAEIERKLRERAEREKEIMRRERLDEREEGMLRRHAVVLKRALWLQTESEPRLFYKPWRLTREQKEKVEKQVADAEKQIEREKEEFRGYKESRLRELGVYSSSSPGRESRDIGKQSGQKEPSQDDRNRPPPRSRKDEMIEEYNEDTVC